MQNFFTESAVYAKALAENNEQLTINRNDTFAEYERLFALQPQDHQAIAHQKHLVTLMDHLFQLRRHPRLPDYQKLRLVVQDTSMGLKDLAFKALCANKEFLKLFLKAITIPKQETTDSLYEHTKELFVLHFLQNSTSEHRLFGVGENGQALIDTIQNQFPSSKMIFDVLLHDPSVPTANGNINSALDMLVDILSPSTTDTAFSVALDIKLAAQYVGGTAFLPLLEKAKADLQEQPGMLALRLLVTNVYLASGGFVVSDAEAAIFATVLKLGPQKVIENPATDHNQPLMRLIKEVAVNGLWGAVEQEYLYFGGNKYPMFNLKHRHYDLFI